MFKKRDPKQSLMEKLAKASSLTVRGNHQKAVSLFDEILSNPVSAGLDDKDLALCYLNRGYSLRRTGNIKTALEDQFRAAQLNPSNFKSHLNAGLIYAQDLNMYEEGLVEFDKAYELNPTSVDVLSSRGLTKLLMGRVEEAKADMLAALAIMPDHSDTLCNLGNMYYQEEQFEEAAEAFQKALHSSPNDIEIRCNLTMALLKSGCRNAAINVLNQDKKAKSLWQKTWGDI